MRLLLRQVASRCRQRREIVLLLAGVVALFGVQRSAANAAPLLQYTFDEASSGTTTAFNTGTLGSAANLTNFVGSATRIANTPANASVAALNVGVTTGTENEAKTAAAVSGTDNLTAVTVTAWVNLQGEPTGFNRILDVSNNWGLLVNSGTASAFTLDLFNNLGADFPSNATANASNKWLFVAATFNGAAHNVTYYTGDAATAISQLGTPITDTFSDTGPGGVVSIGGKPTSAIRTLDGYIDDVRVYGTVLNTTQIDGIRLADLTPVPEPASVAMLLLGLVGLWGTARYKRKG